ncbi:MAG TPA: signal peptidase I [Clostridia bacterium]|jgi:signal peptidase I|nr:signal peptidase I [Clostridia bacterium]
MEKELEPRETVWDWIRTLIFAAVIAYLISHFVIGVVLVPTGSMIPTINIQDRILSNRFIYHFREIRRGEIVLFYAPDKPGMIYVKRVIGLPGDEVVIKDGNLFINGQEIQEDYLNEPMRGDFGPYLVPEGHYFMLGDNRNSSNDSRFWDNKYVSKDKIIGKAFFRIFPLNKMGFLR